jgi:hypothetical protein
MEFAWRLSLTCGEPFDLGQTGQCVGPRSDPRLWSLAGRLTLTCGEPFDLGGTGKRVGPRSDPRLWELRYAGRCWGIAGDSTHMDAAKRFEEITQKVEICRKKLNGNVAHFHTNLA